MSLLVTSCTMGKNPDRLLHKGAAYLRTRTNIGMFGAQNRKSAVELLAASKSQFYVKSSVQLDQHQDLAVSQGQNKRYSTQGKQKQPLRSKSEFDLSQLQLTRAEDESDENNNDTSIESITQSDNDVLDGTQRLSLEDCVPVKTRLQRNHEVLKQSSLEKQDAAEPPKHYAPERGSKSFSDDELVQTSVTILKFSCQTKEGHLGNGETQCKASEGEIALKKPVPLPRKSKEKPVPPPRRRVAKTPSAEGNRESGFDQRQAQSEPHSLHSSTALPSIGDTPRTRKVSESKPVIPKKPETLARRFSSLSSTPSPPTSGTPQNTDGATKNQTAEAVTEHKCTYTATPIFISRPETHAQNFQARPVFISQSGICLTHHENSTGGDNSDSITSKGRKRCPDVPASTKFIKREKKSSASDSSTAISRGRGDVEPEEKNTESSTLKPEMSIESADQAVYHSGINALPSAQMEADLEQGGEGDAREVTRSNSSLSGLIDQQDMSPLSLSPTPYCSTVPRSHSDISCRLESQHSRDSSLVSSHSRLSRASAGADLENFFNQMGLEKGILEPISRLKELQTSEIFDSVSSLDSHDAASICSTYSRSDQEWSETQSLERSHQQTSIIERNARIIKWLCNVRKAKTPAQKAETAAESKD